jgi:Kef-type K+ transport system membrane component KefB
VLGLIPDVTETWFPIIANMALVMVGFLLGEKLSREALRAHGGLVLSVSTAVVLTTAACVFAGMIALGVPLPFALLLAGIAPATAPAATVDVVHELGAQGPFSSTLLGVVALDDAWGLLLFSVLLATAEFWQGASGFAVLGAGLWHVGGALLLGAAIGLPMAYLTGRIDPGEPTLAEALGSVLLCGGLAIVLDVSFLLAAMSMGAVVANLARHHERPFHAIEGIEWPFLILFFLFAGSRLRVDSFRETGAMLGLYVAARIVGRLAGAKLGTWFSAEEPGPDFASSMGLALMPQAGVALGMALIATQRFPEFDPYLSLVIAATVLFELFGPVLTRRSLVRMGETRTS